MSTAAMAIGAVVFARPPAAVMMISLRVGEPDSERGGNGLLHPNLPTIGHHRRSRA